MKITKLSVIAVALASLIMVSCSTMSQTGKGAAIGGGGGAALGAAVGALAGGGKGAAIGAAVGAGVGAGTGALIGRRMDKKQAELEKIKNAEVEQVTDKHGLQAIKVTFKDGILFAFNSTELSSSAQNSLSEFAGTVKSEPDMDVTIYGHTDNRGTHEVNERVSTQRANSVQNYLLGRGVSPSQIVLVKGLAFDSPIADNSTEAGRAQNRRVEIYLTASTEMIKEAEASSNK